MMLNPELAQLLSRAREARAFAYAPYSGYAVGAAVLAADGRVFQGCNVENAMYGATVCAERVAAWSAIAGGAISLRAVAVVTPNGGTPCGFCRQVLAELGSPELVVVFAGPEGEAEVLDLAELLPYSWGPEDLTAGRT